MFRKLLKYDFKSLFKYWWIAALASAIFSTIGGISISLLVSEKDLPDIVTFIAVLSLIFVVLSMGAFSIAALILIIKRFYTNFFTDEGYLTFTLPVKKTQLLNSKLISSFCLQALTTVTLILDLVILLCVGFSKKLDSYDLSMVFDMLGKAIKEAVDFLGVYTFIYIIEILAIMCLSSLFTILFMFCCVTFASVIAKKGRIIKAIAIYYLANSVISFAMQIFITFGSQSAATWMSSLRVGLEKPMIALVLLLVIAFISLGCSLVYTLQYRLLDRKLNLS